ADIPVLCGHLHLPFQAGSDAILERMHRGYTAAQYIEKIDKLRNAAPDIAMSSDAMVGFPGETVEEFHKTLQLLEKIRFDSLFSFRYSDRPFAKSSRLPNKISYKVKAARLAELQALQMEITMERSRAEIGRIRDVLVEGPSKTGDGQFTGRTEQNRVVNFDGSGVRVGDVIRVRILDAFSHSLKGEVVLGHGL
ncbi:MAG: TRAM domain-containing protein, partial [Syntrophobacteraceae bacterium]